MHIDAALVSRLIESQFPRWSRLPLTAAEPNGWHNRTFRLGWYGQPVWVHGDVSYRRKPGGVSRRTCDRCGNLGARGRSWALWKALITYVGSLETDPAAAAAAWRVIDIVLVEHAHAV